jgi:phage-related protein (TIGR01555 family)
MWTFDRLVNLVAGLGTAKDKRTATRYGVQEMDQQQALAAYRGDWIARKVVNIPAFDMVREGRNWKAGKTKIEALEAEEARLQVWPKLAKALKLARLYGGSAIIIGVEGDDPSRPLQPTSIAKGDLSYIHVANRYQIQPGEINNDPGSADWDEPLYYTMSSAKAGSIRIDPSRVIRFIGADVPDTTFAHGWGDSVLMAVSEAIENAGLASTAIAQLLLEAKVDVYKIPDFMRNVGDEAYRQKVIERVSLSQQAKSITNGILMDAAEDYIQKQVSFAQLPETLQLYLQIAAGAADIPATRFLSQSPAGMNSTGESDVRNYYDRLAADQEIDLRPKLEKLDNFLIPSALGSRPGDVYFEFAPLWQSTEKEKADIFKTKSDGARALAGAKGGPLLPVNALSDALVNTFTEDGSLPGLEAAIEEHGKLSEQGPADPAAEDPPEPADDLEQPPQA